MRTKDAQNGLDFPWFGIMPCGTQGVDLFQVHYRKFIPQYFPTVQRVPKKKHTEIEHC